MSLGETVSVAKSDELWVLEDVVVDVVVDVKVVVVDVEDVVNSIIKIISVL